MSDKNSDGDKSEVGTSILTLVGGGTGGGESTPLAEPFASYKAEFTEAENGMKLYIKDLLPGEKAVGQKLAKKLVPGPYKAFQTAMKNLDDKPARVALDLYKGALQKVRDDIADVMKTRQLFSTQVKLYEEEPIDFWQGAADLLRRYKVAIAEAKKSGVTAVGALKNNRDQLAVAARLAKAVADTAPAVERPPGTVHLLDWINDAQAGPETVGSIAWFEEQGRLLDELAGVTEEEGADDDVDDSEWKAVVDDIQNKWNAFRDSGFDWSQGTLRGPSMPSSLYTTSVRAKLKVGARFRIGGKVYEVGSSDTGGISLKTEFPRRHQGTNSRGQWVKSFIYHLQSTH